MKACADRLRELGYPECDESNVLNELIYARFARDMIEGTIDDVGEHSAAGRVCRELIETIDGNLRVIR